MNHIFQLILKRVYDFKNFRAGQLDIRIFTSRYRVLSILRQGYTNP